jgi:hypothetical protein
VANSQSSKRVIVSLDDAAVNDPAKWRQAIDALRKHGLVISKEMSVVGTVAGSIASDRKSSLSNLPLVAHVADEEQRRTQ